MANVVKIDSNDTGFRIAEEAVFGQLSGSEVWYPYEPNSHSDNGPEYVKESRRPISEDGQRLKPVLIDLNVADGFNQDLTQTNVQRLLQGFLSANYRTKGEEVVTAVDIDTINPDEYEVASTTGFLVGSIIKGSNFTNAGNNTVNLVTAIVPDVSVEVADGVLTAEALPPSDAQITVVGHAAALGDINVDVTGTFPALTSSVLDFTTLGLNVGEKIFVGGDTASNGFTNVANNGFKRIRSISANRLEFDKSLLEMVNEVAAGVTLLMYFGRVLKNEKGAFKVRKSYVSERTLGAPDDAQPTEIQAQYNHGLSCSELTINVPIAGKITMDMSFVGISSSVVDGPTPLKAGARPALADCADAYNSSSDFNTFNMSVFTDGIEAPTPLFGFVEDLSITINTNITVNKAVSTFGGFSVSFGSFDVGGSVNAYFSHVDSILAIEANSNMTISAEMVRNNTGIVIDMPLIGLGGGRLAIEQDAPLKIPVDVEAATAKCIDPNLDHTIMFVFYDYLPTIAAV